MALPSCNHLFCSWSPHPGSHQYSCSPPPLTSHISSLTPPPPPQPCHPRAESQQDRSGIQYIYSFYELRFTQLLTEWNIFPAAPSQRNEWAWSKAEAHWSLFLIGVYKHERDWMRWACVGVHKQALVWVSLRVRVCMCVRVGMRVRACMCACVCVFLCVGACVSVRIWSVHAFRRSVCVQVDTIFRDCSTVGKFNIL